MERRFQKIYSQGIELPEYIKQRFAIVSCLAYGAKQQVYLVRDKGKRAYILKIAEYEKMCLLKKDAAVLRHHRFSFFPKLYLYMEERNRGYLLREYIEGDTIWEVVNRKGPFGIRKAGEVLSRICEMTAQLHNQKPPMIHRDIKPQNIVWTREENLFFIDAGTVRTYQKDKYQDTVVVGTRPTAAPEQYGYRQTDERTDIYSLGVLYFFMLTGSLHMEKECHWRFIPPGARKIIRKCTRMDPDDRYQDCMELKKAIHLLYRYETGRKFLRRKRNEENETYRSMDTDRKYDIEQ